MPSCDTKLNDRDTINIYFVQNYIHRQKITINTKQELRINILTAGENWSGYYS